MITTLAAIAVTAFLVPFVVFFSVKFGVVAWHSGKRAVQQLERKNHG